MTLTNKILVTGAGGLIGNAICNSLHNQQQPLVGLYKSTPEKIVLWPTAIANIEKDDLQKILDEKNISVIIHCAAVIPGEQFSFSDCYRINTAIDKKIIDYTNKNNIEKTFLFQQQTCTGFQTK